MAGSSSRAQVLAASLLAVAAGHRSWQHRMAGSSSRAQVLAAKCWWAVAATEVHRSCWAVAVVAGGARSCWAPLFTQSSPPAIQGRVACVTRPSAYLAAWLIQVHRSCAGLRDLCGSSPLQIEPRKFGAADSDSVALGLLILILILSK